MLLAGEAGIGKSRLTAALEDNIKHEAARVPALLLLSRTTRAARCSRSWRSSSTPRASPRDDTPRGKRAKFEHCWRRATEHGGGEVALFARAYGSWPMADRSSGRSRPAAKAAQSPRRADRRISKG